MLPSWSEHSRGPSECSKETATSESYPCFRCLFHGVLPSLRHHKLEFDSATL